MTTPLGDHVYASARVLRVLGDAIGTLDELGGRADMLARRPAAGPVEFRGTLTIPAINATEPVEVTVDHHDGQHWAELIVP